MIEITSEALNSIRLRCEARMPFQSSEVLSLIAEVERMRAERQWRPMGTAPRTLDDRLLLLRDGRVRIGWWCASESWAFCEVGSLNVSVVRGDDSEVMGWMPLPKPLSISAEGVS